MAGAVPTGAGQGRIVQVRQGQGQDRKWHVQIGEGRAGQSSSEPGIAGQCDQLECFFFFLVGISCISDGKFVDKGLPAISIKTKQNPEQIDY